MIILPVLTTSVMHISLKGWENAPFELGVTGFISDNLMFCDPETSKELIRRNYVIPRTYRSRGCAEAVAGI